LPNERSIRGKLVYTNMPEHDPLKFAKDLSAKLASRSRHVCGLLGAGISAACGLPDVAELQKRVIASLGAEDKKLFAGDLNGANLEEALSRLRRIAVLLGGNKEFEGLTAAKAQTLDKRVCKAIVKELDIKTANLKPVYQLAAWAKRADYRLPLQLFTINYDLLLETALDKLGVPYFDGFVGTLQARFYTDLVEATRGRDEEWVPSFFVRLWKLHGSVNWIWDDDHQIVRLGQPVSEGAAAIYPSDTKYQESRRVPFVVLQDRLRRSLHEPETLLIVSGYSFSDADLNELIFDAAARRARSEFIVFCHSKLPEVLVERAASMPNLQAVTGDEAILGGLRANWKAPKEAPEDLWRDGKLAFRDFTHLAAYLARSSPPEPETDAFLRRLLNRMATEGAGSENKGDG
jgi:hypothetical protein